MKADVGLTEGKGGPGNLPVLRGNLPRGMGGARDTASCGSAGTGRTQFPSGQWPDGTGW